MKFHKFPRCSHSHFSRVKMLLTISIFAGFANSTWGDSSGLTRERWQNVSGNETIAIPFHLKPDSSDLVKALSFNNVDQRNFGQRISGYLMPTATGLHTFWVAGDDQAELWLSSALNPADRQLIAWVNSRTGADMFDVYPTQKSSAIQLTKGKKYFIELIGKQGGGVSHLSVVWKAPGQNRAPIPVSSLSPAPAPTVLSDSEDPDGDGLPSDWERAHGLDPLSATGIHGALGDPDGDAATNFQEFKQGTNPRIPERHPGHLTYEIWNNVPGLTVDEVRYSGIFAQKPAVKILTSKADARVNYGDRYLSRMRGYLIPEISGVHYFWLSGDNYVELWMSDTESKFHKRQVAKVHAFTPRYNWDSQFTQKSPGIWLEKGKRYYLEILHKEDVGGDHFALAWQPPGGARSMVPSSRFASFIPQADDLDDDDLLDSWERANGLSATDNGSKDAVNGGFGDLDQDQLSNLEEFLLDSNASVSDSDGDGLEDRLEAEVLGTSVNSKDALSFVNAISLQGAQVTSKGGTWNVDEGKIYNASPDKRNIYNDAFRGWVEYTFTLPSDGFHLIELGMGPRMGGELNDLYEVVFTFNGGISLRGARKIAPGTTGKVQVLSPWLKKGPNTLRVFVDNALTYRRVNLISVDVLRAVGSSWISTRLAQRNGIDKSAWYSRTSPACVEGRAEHFAAMGASGLDLQPAPDKRWFANVALQPGVDQSHTLSFENGKYRKTTKVKWIESNLFSMKQLWIRKGDSLLLAGWKDARDVSDEITIKVEGRTLKGDGKSHFVHRFAKPGAHSVEVTLNKKGTLHKNTVTIDVLEVPELGSPVLVQDIARKWVTPSLPGACRFQWSKDVESIQLSKSSSGSYTFSLKSSTLDDSYALVRVGGGAVISSIPLRKLRIRDEDESSIQVVGLPDPQTYLVETPAIFNGRYPDIEMSYEIFIGGVVFEDGTVKHRFKPADSMDAWNTCRIRMLKARDSKGSICNRASIWQDGIRIAYFH
jgi:hypothetical protein